VLAGHPDTAGAVEHTSFIAIGCREQGNDASISCSPLAGTLASSTASCLGVAFPQGVTIADIRAVW